MRSDSVRAAIEKCERYGLPLTVAHVVANMELTPGDYNQLIIDGLKVRVGRVMRRLGYITNNEVTNTKVEMTDASLTDLEALLLVKARNKERVRVQYEALKMLVEFLRAKQVELGYEPYVRLFEDDARRIYAMHGLQLPQDWDK